MKLLEGELHGERRQAAGMFVMSLGGGQTQSVTSSLGASLGATTLQ